VRQLDSVIKDNREGTVFIVSLLVTSFLIILVAAFMGWVIFEYQMTGRSHKEAAAEALADAGIDRAIWELNYGDGSWSGWNSSVSGTTTTRTRTFSSFQTQSGQTIGDFAVTLTVPSSETPVTIVAIGYVPNQASAAATRTVKVSVDASLFGKGVVSLTSLGFTGNSTTNSYDSALGAYGIQPHTQHGDVATNGNITMTGNVEVYGDATPGPSHTVSMSGNSSVSGSTSAVSSNITLDSIPSYASYYATHNNNASISSTYLSGTTLSVTGNNTLNLQGGYNYYFTSASVSGNATINITGGGSANICVAGGNLQITGNAVLNIGTSAVNFWIEGGNVSTTGNGLYNSGASTNLTLYSTGNSISFTGNASFSGGVYAPNATVQSTGNADVYGSVYCRQFTATGNANIHHDLAQRRKKSPFSTYKVLYWQEK